MFKYFRKPVFNSFPFSIVHNANPLSIVVIYEFIHEIMINRMTPHIKGIKDLIK